MPLSPACEEQGLLAACAVPKVFVLLATRNGFVANEAEEIKNIQKANVQVFIFAILASDVSNIKSKVSRQPGQGLLKWEERKIKKLYCY